MPGRCFPVDIVYAKEDHFKDHVSAAIDTVLQIHMHQPPGEAEMEGVLKRGEGAACAGERRGQVCICLLAGDVAIDTVLQIHMHQPPGEPQVTAGGGAEGRRDKEAQIINADGARGSCQAGFKSFVFSQPQSHPLQPSTSSTRISPLTSGSILVS